MNKSYWEFLIIFSMFNKTTHSAILKGALFGYIYKLMVIVGVHCNAR